VRITTRFGGAREARRYAENHPGLGLEVVIGEEISTLNSHPIGR
jgi:hypothetical protein